MIPRASVHRKPHNVKRFNLTGRKRFDFSHRRQNKCYKCYKLQLLRGSKLLQQDFWQFFFNLSDVTAGNGFAAEKFFTLTFFAQRKSCLWKSGGKGFQNKSEARDSKSVFAAGYPASPKNYAEVNAKASGGWEKE
jgi:hypothetical protein